MPIPTENNRSINILPTTEVILDETRKWARFLAIIGFIFSGLMLLLAIFFLFYSIPGETVTGLFSRTFLVMIYLVSALVNFFPCYYLYKFSGRLRIALDMSDSETLEQSMNYLKRCFRFLGIIFIIMLVIYVVGFIFGLLYGLFFSELIPSVYTLHS